MPVFQRKYRIVSYRVLQVEHLSHELREPILLAACWLTLSSEMKAKMRPNVDTYVTLASVCDRFHDVVRGSRFKRIIKRSLKGLSRPDMFFVFFYKRLTALLVTQKNNFINRTIKYYLLTYLQFSLTFIELNCHSVFENYMAARVCQAS